jgi:hypothetical protein
MFRLWLNCLLFALICFCWISCGGRPHEATVSTAELRASLKPLPRVGAYVGFNPKTHLLTIGNERIERQMLLGKGSLPIQTVYYSYKPSGENDCHAPGEDFRFRIGEIVFSGASALLTYDAYQVAQMDNGGKSISIQFTHASAKDKTPVFRLWARYEIPPDLPVIRKWLMIQNLTEAAFFIEDLAAESLPLLAERKGRIQLLRCDLSRWEGAPEAFVLLYDAAGERGAVVGNDSPGLLKSYQIFSSDDAVRIGADAEIRVPPMQEVETPSVWTMLFGAPEITIETLATKLSPCPERLNAKKPVIEWAGRASDWRGPTRAAAVVFDYDWNIDDLETLKQASRELHNNGKKFGVRLPLAEIHATVLDRPAWRLTPRPLLSAELGARSAEQNSTTHLSETSDAERMVYCVLSGYGYYLAQAVKTLIEETAADVLIFDGSLLGAPDEPLKGCDAFGHEHYTRSESIGLIYRWLFTFADYLREQYPSLQLGITASAYGVAQPDTACLAHFDFFFERSMR